MDPDTLDPLDRRLLHALQIDGRAPFSRIAHVLGVSDRTVARRYARLRAEGNLRVSAATTTARTGEAEWVVRMRVAPHHAAALTRILAARPDTAWVTVLSGGTEILCLFRTADHGPTPLAEISRHPHLTGITAQRMLRYLMNRPWQARTSALTDAEIRALEPPRDTTPPPLAASEMDRGLLAALSVDARTDYPTLARRLGWSESAVRRRLDDLRRADHLHFTVDTDPALFGYTAQTMFWLTVAPAHLATVTETLAADPTLAFLGSITGPHNLMAIAIHPDTTALHTHLTTHLAELPGLTHVDSAAITSYAKRHAATPFAEPRSARSR